jgi:hypothetical protein
VSHRWLGRPGPLKPGVHLGQIQAKSVCTAHLRSTTTCDSRSNKTVRRSGPRNPTSLRWHHPATTRVRKRVERRRRPWAPLSACMLTGDRARCRWEDLRCCPEPDPEAVNWRWTPVSDDKAVARGSPSWSTDVLTTFEDSSRCLTFFRELYMGSVELPYVTIVSA